MHIFWEEKKINDKIHQNSNIEHFKKKNCDYIFLIFFNQYINSL